MIVEELTASAEREWDAYVEGHPDANCYHLRAWRDVGVRAYRLRAPFLVARETPRGAVRGVLPLFVVKNLQGGYVTTGLFGAYGRVLADDQEAGRALIARAKRITGEARARYLMLKAAGDEPLAEGFARRDTSVFARLPLAPDPETLWKGFKKEIRKAVRKAEGAGLTVHVGPEQLPVYYDILAEAMLIKGTPIYGYAFMRVLAESLGARAEVMTLRKDGQPISGALYLFSKDTVYLPFSASLPSAFELRPNNLLFWEIIKRGCARGMKTLDLGRSPKDSSLLTFKLRWGAETTPQPWYIHTARGAPPALDAHDPSVQRLIQAWQRLPRFVADALGPEICRRFLA